MNKISRLVSLPIVIRAVKKFKQDDRIEQINGHFSRRQTGEA